MKAIMGLVMLSLVSIAASEDTEERIRARAEKLATMAAHMSRHLDEGLGHAEQAPASLMRHARKDERRLSAKMAEHAEKIRRVRDQISEHRQHMEQSMPHELRDARAAQHSLDDMKTNKDSSRTPSAAKNARKQEKLDKLATHMSHHFDATAARNAAMKMDASHLSGMQHGLERTGVQKFHRKDAKGEFSSPAEEGQE